MRTDLEIALKLIKGRPRLSINIPSGCVRVYIGGRHGDQEYFSRKAAGGWTAAVLEAIEFEEGFSDYYRAGRRKPRQEPFSRSVSGIVGVCPLKHKKDLMEVVGWRAHWVEPDATAVGGYRRKTKDFRYSVHGQNAKDIATAYREEMMREHYPYMFSVKK